MIGEVKDQHPDVLFLAEAFTRPQLMYRLAKLGFSQSYTYFTWRNTKPELTNYFQELGGIRSTRILSAEPVAEYARHSAGVSADRRAGGLHDPLDSGRHSGSKLRDLRPGF